MFTRKRNLLCLLNVTKRLKESLPLNSELKYSHRVEYLIIKANQLVIIDTRVLREIRRIDLVRKNHNYWRTSQFQVVFSELILDTESFFYVASKFIDLYFEGLKVPFDLGRNIKEKYPACERILDIRNNLIEHSHSGAKAVDDEICSFGYNSRYGSYLRSSKRADMNKPYRERSYLLLRNRFIKEMIDAFEKSIAKH